jgi:hypothetical protein
MPLFIKPNSPDSYIQIIGHFEGGFDVRPGRLSQDRSPIPLNIVTVNRPSVLTLFRFFELWQLYRFYSERALRFSIASNNS